MAKTDKKEDEDFNIEKSQLDAFASRLANMAEVSQDTAMTKLADSTLIMLDDESLANVEVDTGDSQAEQPLGA